MDGRFENNTLLVDIQISSPLESSIKANISFGLDTGFTGDLCLTYKEAFPLALSLVGVQDYFIADGSKVTFFECIGIVSFDGKSVSASISIRPSGSLLMGMSLMKKLGIKLEVDFPNETVKLLPSHISGTAKSKIK